MFRESTATLLAELGKLRGIVGRFSDFAKMPQPQLETVDLNGLVRDSLKLFEAQMQAAGVTLRLDLAADLRAIQADPGQLGRALQNLVLNAIDAMPSGGALTIRTAAHEGGVRLEVSDTGQGLTRGRMRPPLHAVLHDQDARHRIGLGDRAIGDQRPRGQDRRAQRAGQGDDIRDRSFLNFPWRTLQTVVKK